VELLEHQLAALTSQLDQLQARVSQTADQVNFTTTHLRSRAVVRGHRMYLDPTDNVVSPTLLAHGIFEPLETELVEREVCPGDVVLDIGANVGYYTLIFAERVGESGHVFAFEPDPDNFALLEKNVRANRYSNVTLERKAVSDVTGKIKLYTCPDNKGDHRIYDSGDGRRSIDIDAVALDDYFAEYQGRIDFIKMDTQGAEAGILRGMTGLLRQHDGIKMVTEFWPVGLRRFGASAEQFLNHLSQLGFCWTVIDEAAKDFYPASISQLLQTYVPEKENFTNLYCVRGSAMKPEKVPTRP
jgi:FkbM family methyltransferase